MTGRLGRASRGVLLPTVLAVLAAAAAAVFLLVRYADRKLSGLVVGGLGESFSTTIYGSPFLLNDQVHQSPERLMKRLDRLRYRVSASSSPAPGEYVWEPPVLSVGLRGFTTPQVSQPAGRVRLTWRPGNLWEVRGDDGNVRSQAALEPELLDELSGPLKVRRDPAVSSEIPALLKNAAVSVEDRRFYRHFGLDPRGLARAAWRDLRGRGGVQGGSTITQQLAKNFFLSPRRTLRRKAAEAVLALYLEVRYTKDEILTLYLNHIYLGQEGSVSVAGVKAAAKFYFGKDLRDLTLAECATLAGLIRSPYRYNPRRDPAACRSRRNFVLAKMREQGMIAEPELREALSSPVATVPLPPEEGGSRAGSVVGEVLRLLTPRYGEDALFRYGLRVDTTIDPLMQSEAQDALAKGRHQAALAALDPQTGRVLALAGGRDYRESQFNRATQARRQPGSAFKPFTYGAALEAGFTPATVLEDRRRDYTAEDSTWAPRNYEGIYLGTATLREALAHSLNAATLDLAGKTGLAKVLAYARKLGIEGPLQRNLATILGASEVSLLELTAAYAPFDNGGFRVKPYLIADVQDAEGGVLEFTSFDRTPVLTPAESFLMTSLLEGVVQRGTARGLAKLGWDRPAAGKTGTTNDGRDAWFIGYTPELVAGVWFGDDKHVRLNATGAKDALPLWAAFMKAATADYPSEPFAKPEEGLVEATIDPLSGLLAQSGCPQRVQEQFLAGTQPTRPCPLHPGGIRGWFKRVFGKRRPL